MDKRTDHGRGHNRPLKELLRGLHHHFHQLIELRRSLIEMSQVTDALKATMAEQRTVVDGAVTFIVGVPDLVAEAVRKALVDAGVDNAAVELAVTEATAEAKDQTEDLKAALVRGTGEQLPTP